MRYGICAPFRAVAGLHTLPFDYLEVGVQPFLLPEQSQETFEEQWQEARLLVQVPIEAANALFPADLPLIETPARQVDRDRIESYVRTVLQRAEQVGIRIIVFGSGAARACPAGYDRQDAERQIAEYLETWSEWGRNHGVQFVLEPLRYEETNMLNTVAECGLLVTHIAESGARLLVDAYHMACNGENPATILPYGSLLTHVHVAEQQERAAPGRHGEDFRPFFAALHRIGYDQRISIECNWSDLAAEVGPALVVLREQWDASVQ